MVMTGKEGNQFRERATGKNPPCQVTFIVGDHVFSGTSVHFSGTGMLVVCQQPAQLFTKLKLALKFPGHKNSLKVGGEVVWTNIHGPADSLSPRGMGVKFINLDQDVERLLEEQARNYESFGDIYACYYT
jgi:hypothetical protein